MAKAKLRYKNKAERDAALAQVNAQVERIAAGADNYAKARKRYWLRSAGDGNANTFATRAAMEDLNKRVFQAAKAAKNRKNAIMNASIAG